MKRLFSQSLAFTFGTFANAAELFCPSLSSNSHVGIPHLLNVLDQSAEFCIDIIRGLRLIGRNAKALRTALQNLVDSFIWDLAKRCVNRASILFQNGFHLPENHGLLCFAKRSEASVLERKGRVGDDFVSVDNMNEAQAFTTRASALRTIE